jgi:endonuclease VIII
VPEGDTVWLAAQRLREALAGRVITASDFRVPALATVDLSGVRIEDVVPRGKHLLFRLDDGRTLHTHFRMDGSWHLYRPDVPWRGGPGHSVRVVLCTDEWIAVGYRLPVVDLLATTDEASVVGHLGPDILGPDWDPDEARHRDRPGTPRPAEPRRDRADLPVGDAVPLRDQPVHAGGGGRRPLGRAGHGHAAHDAERAAPLSGDHGR